PYLDPAGDRRPGDKLARAQALVVAALRALPPGVAFDVVAFAGKGWAWRGSLASATPEARAEAEDWALRQRASGGTDLSAGVIAALASDWRELTLVLLSDGTPTQGPETAELQRLVIAQENAR